MIIQTAVRRQVTIIKLPVGSAGCSRWTRISQDRSVCHAPAAEIWKIMQHDKKARGGKVRFILPTAPGEVDVFDNVSAEQVRDTVNSLT